MEEIVYRLRSSKRISIHLACLTRDVIIFASVCVCVYLSNKVLPGEIFIEANMSKTNILNFMVNQELINKTRK